VPHSRPVLFIDRSLGKHIVADTLRRAGVHVEVLDDHFHQDTPDDIWLRFVGKRGWVAVTRDRYIRYNPLAKAAITEAKVIMVTLVAKNTTAHQWAQFFLKAMKEIESVAAISTPPALFTFGSDGKLKPVPL
jgi:hypothetical protein